MNCKNCNSPLEEGSLFCSNCGQRVEEINETPFVEEQNTESVENATSVEETAPTIENNIPVEEPEPVVENTTINEPITPVIEKPIEPVINNEASKKKSNGGLIALFIVLGVLLLGGLTFGAIKLIPKFSQKSTPIVDPTKETNKEETIEYEGYTFTVPSGYTVKKDSGYYQFGNSKFKVLIASVESYYSYSQFANATSVEAFVDDFKKYISDSNSSTKYISNAEETYGGKKFLIFSFEQSGVYADAVLTELPDKEVLLVITRYDDINDKKEGYTNLAKFISSAVKEGSTTTTDDTATTKTDEPATVTTTTENYTVMGDDTLGYLKLPGSWIKGKVAGASDSSLQYFTYNNGKYIITLDVIDKAKYTDIKTFATALEYSYKSDSDATNISVSQTKVGSYDAYQVKVQYKSDSVWVYSYVFKSPDGVIRMIQTEGLDPTNDYFKIPNTFSLTKIN